MKVDYFPMFSTSVCGDVAGIIFTEGTRFIICTRLQIPKEIIFFVQAACCGCFHWENISATAQAKRGPAGPISAAHSPAGTAHILTGLRGRREAAHSGLRKLIFEL
jgi:hypothetical protein